MTSRLIQWSHLVLISALYYYSLDTMLPLPSLTSTPRFLPQPHPASIFPPTTSNPHFRIIPLPLNPLPSQPYGLSAVTNGSQTAGVSSRYRATQRLFQSMRRRSDNRFGVRSWFRADNTTPNHYYQDISSPLAECLISSLSVLIVARRGKEIFEKVNGAVKEYNYIMGCYGPWWRRFGPCWRQMKVRKDTITRTMTFSGNKL